jgi:hypothetical protein
MGRDEGWNGVECVAAEIHDAAKEGVVGGPIKRAQSDSACSSVSDESVEREESRHRESRHQGCATPEVECR